MRINYIQKTFYLLFIGIYIFPGCAKIVTPTGGPKDKDHPLIVESEPPFNKTNFEEDEINITFNEYIQLKDLNSSLIISPPLDEKPEIKVKGKTLNIKFVEPLSDSTTYNIYFGNSVQDYNEGNPIENFQYILSTGTFIDSLSIEGEVLNSFNLLPQENVYVMLYNNLKDSVPIKIIPEYLSKTNEKGHFRINNIGHDNYKLFCLRDLNKNYLFDLPNEEIAFIDSLVRFELITDIKIDTLYKVDTTIISSNIEVLDSTSILPNPEIDTIITEIKSYYPVHHYILMLFQEDREVQYLSNSKRDSKQKIEIMFNKPIEDSIVFFLPDTTIGHDWYIQESSTNNDTIFYWLTDSTIFNKEKIIAAVTYQKEDSNLVYQWNTDTLSLRFVEPKRKRKEVADTLIKYKLNAKHLGTFDLNKHLSFNFETPLELYDTSKIKLFALPDTVKIPIEYDFVKDSRKLRKYEMHVDWAEDIICRLEIYPHAFVDLYESTNDTSIIEFKTQKLDYYGKILANITGIDSSFQIITQLILPEKEEEKIYTQKIIQSDQIIEFDFLPPKEFILKVIIDKNFNDEWNTGEYLEHIQPEEVLYYNEKIKVRSNWDIEINFDVNKK